jgi:O-antigen/teichoic acid export membrane protein
MKSNFWRSVVTVLGGTALAQIIPILGSLIVARQYAPTEFGIYSGWLGVVMLLAILLTGRFETALAIESDGEPRRLAVISTLSTCLLVACGAGLFLAIFIWLGVGTALLDKIPSQMVSAMVPTAFAIASAQTWQSWAAAEGNYRQLNLMRITEATMVTIAQISAGTMFKSAIALAIAYLLGILCGLFVAVRLMPLGEPPTGKYRVTVSEFWRRNHRFPLISLPADAINTAAVQLPILIVGNRFGAETAGLLAMTMRIMGAPIGLLGKSVLDVFKRHAATSFRERGECRNDYIRTFKVLLIGSLAFCAVMAFSNETLFTLALGENWRGAGTFAVWLLPLFALRFMASPLSYIVYIAGKQHVDLFWQVALLGMTVITLSYPQHHDLAVQSYSGGYSLLYVIYLFMSYRFSLGVKK